jgi:hypothetical protein
MTYLPPRSAVSLAKRSARSLSVFSRTNRMLAWYSVIASVPSLARSCFLKLASARARASSILVVNVFSYSADENVFEHVATLYVCMLILQILQPRPTT